MILLNKTCTRFYTKVENLPGTYLRSYLFGAENNRIDKSFLYFCIATYPYDENSFSRGTEMFKKGTV